MSDTDPNRNDADAISDQVISCDNNPSDPEMVPGSQAPVPDTHETMVLNELLGKMSIKDRQSADDIVFGRSLTISKSSNNGNKNGKKRNKGVDNERKPTNNSDLAEDPSFQKKLFDELDRQINRIRSSNSGNKDERQVFAAYDLARSDNPVYVDSPAFKIEFLRAERYNPKRAASKLVLYFREKLDLFGRDRLTRDICWEDLGDQGRHYLELGGLQILRKRDKAGRKVVFIGDVVQKRKDPAMLRGIREAYFYFFATLGESDTEEGRINGYVTVLWRVHRNNKSAAVQRNVLGAVCRAALACPNKISAFHVCRPPRKFNLKTINEHAKMLLPFMMNFRITRLFRLHYGTALECTKDLLKYGILDLYDIILHDSNDIDNNDNDRGPFSLEYVEIWKSERMRIEEKKRIENLDEIRLSWNCPTGYSSDDYDDDWSFGGGPLSSSSFSMRSGTETSEEETGDTREADILPDHIKLGRGRPLQDHPGNIWFRELIAGQFHAYDALDKPGKGNLCNDILKTIKSESRLVWKALPGQKTENEFWVEADDKVVRQKVAFTFRTERRKRESQQQKKAKVVADAGSSNSNNKIPLATPEKVKSMQ